MRDESKFRNLVTETLWRNPLVGLAVYDAAQGTLKDANRAFLELLDSRFRTRKTLGMPLEQCMPDFELSGLQDAFRRVLATGMPLHSDNVRLTRQPGGTVTLICTMLPMGADGPAEGKPAPLLLLVAAERRSEAPVAAFANPIDSYTRQGLAQQFHLSAREIDIIGECLQGKKNRQIALDLHIGISTVKRHLESAYRKLDIGSSRSLPGAILKVMRDTASPPIEVHASQRSQAA